MSTPIKKIISLREFVQKQSRLYHEIGIKVFWEKGLHDDVESISFPIVFFNTNHSDELEWDKIYFLSKDKGHFFKTVDGAGERFKIVFNNPQDYRLYLEEAPEFSTIVKLLNKELTKIYVSKTLAPIERILILQLMSSVVNIQSVKSLRTAL